jgi:hypothetical protein
MCPGLELHIWLNLIVTKVVQAQLYAIHLVVVDECL